jgi:aspartyl-tRNA(Asn)/glutamyl-tRNA(Gln) amidotransferase subunit A
MSDVSLSPVASVADAAKRLRSGKLTAVALTESLLSRMAATEPAIHAYVEILREDALQDAARADADFGAGVDRGPLQGIPIGVKDIYDLSGVPTCCGSRVRHGAVPADADSEPVRRLRQAGAVFIGKTVTQEFAAGVVSTPARNPWDPTRIPGGSSGGSAASVAAGSCLVGLGSDTGGSIRIPASVTGTVGLKPTYGWASKRGVYPLSWTLDTVGPITRTVEDAALTLNVIAGFDPGDPTTVDLPVPDAAANIGKGIEGLRLGVVRDFFFERLQPDVATAVDASLDVFRNLGAEVIETRWAESHAARAIAMILNRVESAAVHERTLRESAELIGDDLRLRLIAGATVSGTDYIQALRARVAINRSMATLFAEHRLDGLLAPTLPVTALPADDLVHRLPGEADESVGMAYTRLTQPFNATGQPVLSLPCGIDHHGLPIGLQIAGKPFEEGALCRIGHAYEREAGWWQQWPTL